MVSSRFRISPNFEGSLESRILCLNHKIFTIRIRCNPQIFKSKLLIPIVKIKRFEMFLCLRRCIVPNVPIRACVGQLRKRHSRKCGTPIESISRRQNEGFRIYNVSLSPSLYQKKQFEIMGLLSKWKYTYHFSILVVITSNYFRKWVLGLLIMRCRNLFKHTFDFVVSVLPTLNIWWSNASKMANFVTFTFKKNMTKLLHINEFN